MLFVAKALQELIGCLVLFRVLAGEGIRGRLEAFIPYPAHFLLVGV